jgi:predicted nucleotide-binding protein
MTKNSQDELIRAYTNLKALRDRIAEITTVRDTYVNEFHSTLIRLQDIGIGISEFWIPDSEITPRVESIRTLTFDDRPSGPTYSEEKYVDRSYILMKIDSILGYLENATSLPTPSDEKTTIFQAPKPKSSKTVFVVHGRDDKLRESMFNLLRALGLEPLEWSQAIQATKKSSPYIGEILETAFSLAQAIIVIFSGDDEAKLREEFWGQNEPTYEKEVTPQSRPNVIFEAGMAMGGNESRTILVQVGKLRPISDIAGRHITHLDNSAEKKQELATKLKGAGCEVNTSGTDWLTVGNFQK